MQRALEPKSQLQTQVWPNPGLAWRGLSSLILVICTKVLCGPSVWAAPAWVCGIDVII